MLTFKLIIFTLLTIQKKNMQKLRNKYIMYYIYETYTKNLSCKRSPKYQPEPYRFSYTVVVSAKS